VSAGYKKTLYQACTFLEDGMWPPKRWEIVMMMMMMMMMKTILYFLAMDHVRNNLRIIPTLSRQ
jgi:hypothetical protein